MTEQEIRDLFKSKSVPLGASDVWKVQQALVVKHKALERLAAVLNISYEPPQILRAERDEAVVLVTGKLFMPAAASITGSTLHRSEWSIGEACIGMNYRVSGNQAGYPYAMAEKRAKDRVILKLAGLHGAYSEDEADDFKQQPTAAAKPQPEPVELSITAKTLIQAIGLAKTQPALAQWFADNKGTIEGLHEDEKDEVRMVYAEHHATLKKAA